MEGYEGRGCWRSGRRWWPGLRTRRLRWSWWRAGSPPRSPQGWRFHPWPSASASAASLLNNSVFYCSLLLWVYLWHFGLSMFPSFSYWVGSSLSLVGLVWVEEGDRCIGPDQTKWYTEGERWASTFSSFFFFWQWDGPDGLKLDIDSCLASCYFSLIYHIYFILVENSNVF